MSVDLETLAQIEGAYGPVVADFTLNEVPQGGAPEDVRQQWVGLTLPVRQYPLEEDSISGRVYEDVLTGVFKENNEPVTICGIEAVAALVVAEQFKAAKYFSPYQLGDFVFRAAEGSLVLRSNAIA